MVSEICFFNANANPHNLSRNCSLTKTFPQHNNFPTLRNLDNIHYSTHITCQITRFPHWNTSIMLLPPKCTTICIIMGHNVFFDESVRPPHHQFEHHKQSFTLETSVIMTNFFIEAPIWPHSTMGTSHNTSNIHQAEMLQIYFYTQLISSPLVAYQARSLCMISPCDVCSQMRWDNIETTSGKGLVVHGPNRTHNHLANCSSSYWAISNW